MDVTTRTRPKRTRQWPIPTGQVPALLGLRGENPIRYALRHRLIPEDLLPLLVAGRMLWYPPSLLALADALGKRRIGGFEGLPDAVDRELRAWGRT